ncbi:transposase [Spirosoma foliorum]|uniref:Transposase n=1 Tax=Spirosoma foliorum TaxID=2710596 RepID=A0A7G5H1B0_9BACT|nr:transposase [Spirosoma foliorum]QMW04902.1 transposase [Spirosoma foliorum]
MVDECAQIGPSQLLYHHELRTGTRTELGRKWSPAGHRPHSPIRIGYEFTYLYLALCPFGNQVYAAFLPALTGEWFSWFVAQIDSYLQTPCLFVADGAKAHVAGAFAGTKLRFCRLPAYCPELNPVERVFQEIRRGLKHRLLSSVEEAQCRVKTLLQELCNDAVAFTNLVCFPYIQKATI